MNDEAIDRLNMLITLEDNLRKHPALRKVRTVVMDEIMAYENDPGLLGGVEKPEPPTPNPAAQRAPVQDRTGSPRVQAQPTNENPNDPAASGQVNRRG